MKTNLRILGALFVAVVGGCAGTKSTTIPLSPVALGVPVDASSYDLMVDDAAGGRVILRDGQAIRDANGHELILVGMEIDNRTSDRTFRLPTDQIWLSNFGPQSAKLIQVNRQAAPPILVVAPGETGSYQLTFVPVQPIAIRKISQPEVHWTLLIDGATAPVVRSTTFVAMRGNMLLGRQIADTRNWDPPSTYANGLWERRDNQFGFEAGQFPPTIPRGTGHQRLWQPMPTGQP